MRRASSRMLMVTSRRRPIGRRWSTARSCRRGTTRRFTCTARLSTHPDAESTLAAVRMLTAHFEADRAEPWADTETHQRTTSRAYFEQSSPSRSPVDRIEANKSSPKTAPSPINKASSPTSPNEALQPMVFWRRCNPFSIVQKHQNRDRSSDSRVMRAPRLRQFQSTSGCHF